MKIDDRFWKIDEHPHDVILMLGAQFMCSSLVVKHFLMFSSDGEVLNYFDVRCEQLLFLQFSVVFVRCKQWMHQPEYSHAFVFLPRLWALQRLPVGLPKGQADVVSSKYVRNPV